MFLLVENESPAKKKNHRSAAVLFYIFQINYFANVLVLDAIAYNKRKKLLKPTSICVIVH